MPLNVWDWILIVGYFALSLGIGLAFRKRAGSSFVEYFASGRSLPWWIAGTSMVATTFAADTPLAVTGLVAKHGLAGNWFWWAFALGGMLTVFVFAKLWRRAEVLTDVELIEQRYAGRPAAFLRGFRAAYVAVVMNSIIIGWVIKAMATVLKQTVLHGMAQDATTDFWLVAGLLLLTGVYSVLSGMWGVAITDVVQFVLAIGGCIALAVVAVDHVGGTAALREQVGEGAFAFVPDFHDQNAWLPVEVFLVMVFCQWWATWYPGAEPGGGGYIVQRMAACRDERHAVKATLWFQLAHYCLRPWPWILVAFAALAMHPELREWAQSDTAGHPDPGSGYPMLIRELAPAGLRGLLLVTFFAAFMSTISTQMNWGASYLVNDLYRRFARPAAGDRELLRASRGASLLVLLLGGGAGWFMVVRHVSVDDAWKFLAALGAGVGGVFLLRWFWWRINAWSEIAAMVASLGFFWLLPDQKHALFQDHAEFRQLAVALCSLATWLLVTLLTPAERDGVLVAFYRKVRPDGPGWRRIAALAPEARPDRTLARSLLCALLGTTVIWATLPAIGAVIFADWAHAGMCLSIAVVGGMAMFWLLPRSSAATSQPTP